MMKFLKKIFKSTPRQWPADITLIRIIFHGEKGSKVKKWVDVPGLAVEENSDGFVYIRGTYGNRVARFKEQDVYCVVPANSLWSQKWTLGEK